MHLSPRPSPRASPRASPRGSPNVSTRRNRSHNQLVINVEAFDERCQASLRSSRPASKEMEDAEEFISEFDKAMTRLEELESKPLMKRDSKLSKSSNEGERFDLEEFLKKARLTRKQKQGLLLLILCFDADFPVTVFDKMTRSHTMKLICEEIFDGAQGLSLLTDIA